MKNVAILCDSNPLTRPRPHRLIQMLKNHHSLFVFGVNCPDIKGMQSFAFPPLKSAKDRTPKEQEELESALKNQEFHPLIFTPNRLILQHQLLSTPHLDLLIIEDLVLLPIALSYKESYPDVKLMIDLREFYPLEYENDPSWLESFGRFFSYLCDSYLHQVDMALTVSEGLKQRYRESYDLECELFLSLPPFFDLKPTQNPRIELVYHGFISADRESENLLEIGSSLASHLHLNIIALSNHPRFLESFVSKAQQIPSISILPPVSLEEIIPFTHRFDLGLITLKPNGFNNTHALPNKFFEYIQARLGVIATPLPSLKPIIESHHLGICSKDFETQSLISLLNSLDVQTIKTLKNHAHKASHSLNLSSNQAKILSLISSLLGE
ncbi:hypothetical protein [Helicobacter pametensis]|uniref:hypothetical protein n=1 Tax=Helicobacter pametensis TaxID=95149 RepID=UPI000487A024|nr:hypothetical protein [Helicobacter pametensis]